MNSTTPIDSYDAPGMQKVMLQIQKLLNLAGNNPNSEEAASAAAKAQELLTKYNLDASAIERAGGLADGRREEVKTKGGFYTYQRRLWKAVAELNFCLYWTQTYFVPFEGKHAGGKENRLGNWVTGRWKFRHRLVGRMVNTATTKVMAQYLEDTIERFTREAIKGDMAQRYSRYAMSYREGLADRLIEKIWKRRREMLSDEMRKRKEQEAAMRAEGRPESGMGRDLALSSLVKSEQDANMDFLHGEGYSAKRYAEQAQAAKEAAEEEAAYIAWAKANPEEACQKEAEEEKQRRKWARTGPGSRGGSGSTKSVDSNAYYAGRDAAEKISLDQQVGGGPVGRLK